MGNISTSMSNNPRTTSTQSNVPQCNPIRHTRQRTLKVSLLQHSPTNQLRLLQKNLKVHRKTDLANLVLEVNLCSNNISIPKALHKLLPKNLRSLKIVHSNIQSPVISSQFAQILFSSLRKKSRILNDVCLAAKYIENMDTFLIELIKWWKLGDYQLENLKLDSMSCGVPSDAVVRRLHTLLKRSSHILRQLNFNLQAMFYRQTNFKQIFKTTYTNWRKLTNLSIMAPPSRYMGYESINYFTHATKKSLRNLQCLKSELFYMNYVSSKGVKILLDGILANLKNLKSLDLGMIRYKGFSDGGMSTFSRFLSSKDCQITEFKIGLRNYRRLTDTGVKVLVDALPSKLVSFHLKLSHCDAITNNSLKHLGKVITSKLPALKDLSLGFEICPNLSDEGLEAISKAIESGNVSLNRFEVVAEYHDSFTSAIINNLLENLGKNSSLLTHLKLKLGATKGPSTSVFRKKCIGKVSSKLRSIQSLELMHHFEDQLQILRQVPEILNEVTCNLRDLRYLNLNFGLNYNENSVSLSQKLVEEMKEKYPQLEIVIN